MGKRSGRKKAAREGEAATRPDERGHDAGAGPPAGEAGFRKSALRENFESIVVAVLFATFVRGFIAQPYKIPSRSMAQNLLVGDHLVVNKVLYGSAAAHGGPFFLPTRPIERGDIVIFRPPDEPETDYIKRVIGLPGETIEILHTPERNGDRVVIDGKPLPENYRVRGSEVHEEDGARWTVDYSGRARAGARGWARRTFSLGPDEFFMMGDNRNDSEDSRYWHSSHAVQAERIRGRALFIYWSFDSAKEGIAPEEPPGFFARIGHYARIALRFFPDTRWGRTFKRLT